MVNWDPVDQTVLPMSKLSMAKAGAQAHQLNETTSAMVH